MTDLEKELQFKKALDMDFLVDTLDLLIEQPDFWSTAFRWVTKANSVDSDKEIYSLTPETASRLILLVSGSPLNPECSEPYANFTMAAHDILVNTVRLAINLESENAADRARAKMQLPDPAVPVPMGITPIKTTEELLTSISSQLLTKSKWELSNTEVYALGNLVDQGQFPFALVKGPSRFGEDNAPVATMRNVVDHDSIHTVMTGLLSPKIARSLLRQTLREQLPHLEESIPMVILSPVEAIAYSIPNSPILEAFDVDWATHYARARSTVSRTLGLSDAVYHQPEFEDPEPALNQQPKARQSGYEISR